MRISIPILITDGGDGSVSMTVFKTIEQRNRFADQEEKLYERTMDEGDKEIVIDVNPDGTWEIIKSWPGQQSVEEMLEERDRDIAEGEAE